MAFVILCLSGGMSQGSLSTPLSHQRSCRCPFTCLGLRKECPKWQVDPECSLSLFLSVDLTGAVLIPGAVKTRRATRDPQVTGSIPGPSLLLNPWPSSRRGIPWSSILPSHHTQGLSAILGEKLNIWTTPFAAFSEFSTDRERKSYKLL
jgi:hypothetical protein